MSKEVRKALRLLLMNCKELCPNEGQAALRTMTRNY